MTEGEKQDAVAGCGCFGAISGAAIGFGSGLIYGSLAKGFLVGVLCGVGGAFVGFFLCGMAALILGAILVP